LVEHDLFRIPASTFRDHALRRFVQGVFADFDFVMFAAMRAADVKGGEANAQPGGLGCCDVFNPRVDVPARRWTSKYKPAHGCLPDHATTAPLSRATVVNI
jgi:hypothetical protein